MALSSSKTLSPLVAIFQIHDSDSDSDLYSASVDQRDRDISDTSWQTHAGILNSPSHSVDSRGDPIFSGTSFSQFNRRNAN